MLLYRPRGAIRRHERPPATITCARPHQKTRLRSWQEEAANAGQGPCWPMRAGDALRPTKYADRRVVMTRAMIFCYRRCMKMRCTRAPGANYIDCACCCATHKYLFSKHCHMSKMLRIFPGRRPHFHFPAAMPLPLHIHTYAIECGMIDFRAQKSIYAGFKSNGAPLPTRQAPNSFVAPCTAPRAAPTPRFFILPKSICPH